MENEDGYMALDLTRRVYENAYTSHKERKDSSSNLHRWKIGFGISLAAILVLTMVLMLFVLEVFQGSPQRTQMVSHPVFFPAHLCSSENHNVLGNLYTLPKYNSCILNRASCASVPSEICIEIPKSPLNAVVNQTAIIPVKIQVPKPDWDFIEVLWHHTEGIPDDDFILKYDRRSCSPKSNPQLWWKRECHLLLEVSPAHRWKMSAMMNAWLIIWNIEAKDAGRYQVTVKSSNMKEACSFVELRVTEDSKEIADRTTFQAKLEATRTSSSLLFGTHCFGHQ